ncbi:MAG TPA: AAA family ATPase [Kineosporiaceae bacterium]|nr:AAA family ATPase [Kineosporiaceae bacterium]
MKKPRTIRPGALPVRRVERDPAVELPDDEWPTTIPAIAQLLREGLDLAPVTVLIGENGSGKSTLVEGIAQAYGLSPEGGSTGARHSSRPSESMLHEGLRLSRGLGSTRWGFFLRAETMHGFYSYLEANPLPPASEPEPVFHEISHGESFLALLNSRFRSPGLYVLDEPESALSFSACLGLVGLLHDLVEAGTSQVLVATHSPVVAAIPGARILQLDGDGFHQTEWEELDLVQHYRSFLAEPMRYLRHVL